MQVYKYRFGVCDVGSNGISILNLGALAFLEIISLFLEVDNMCGMHAVASVMQEPLTECVSVMDRAAS